MSGPTRRLGRAVDRVSYFVTHFNGGLPPQGGSANKWTNEREHTSDMCEHARNESKARFCMPQVAPTVIVAPARYTAHNMQTVCAHHAS